MREYENASSSTDCDDEGDTDDDARGKDDKEDASSLAAAEQHVTKSKEENSSSSTNSTNNSSSKDPRARVLNRDELLAELERLAVKSGKSHSKRSDVVRGRTARFPRAPTRSRCRRFRRISERRQILDGELVDWNKENGGIFDAWENEEISNARPRASFDTRRCARFSFPFLRGFASGFSVCGCVTGRSINGCARTSGKNL